MIYIPNKLFRFFAIAFRRKKDDTLLIFVRENFLGFLVGLAISIFAIHILGNSLENITINAIRNVISTTQRALGIDKVTVCVNRLYSTYKWTPDSFLKEAASANWLDKLTLSEREAILAKANIGLIFRQGRSTPEAFYENTLREYCKERG